VAPVVADTSLKRVRFQSLQSKHQPNGGRSLLCSVHDPTSTQGNTKVWRAKTSVEWSSRDRHGYRPTNAIALSVAVGPKFWIIPW
jgi:hypothetical protein